MILLRIVAACLPQLLLILLLGGKLDLLGGWNRTDMAFGILQLLFLLSPLFCSILLLIEIIRHLKMAKDMNTSRSLLMPGVALLLLLESLLLDIFILSQIRMH